MSTNKIFIEWINHSSVELENENGDILKFKTRDGRPRFAVDYKLTDEQKANPDLKLEDKGVTAPFNPKDLEIFIYLMNLVIDKVDDKEFPKSTSVICLYHYDKDGNKSDEKLNRTEVKFYLDIDNVFKIAITDLMYTNKTTVFECGLLSWHKFTLGDKEVPKAFLSKKHAQQYLNNIKDIIHNINTRFGKKQIQEKDTSPVAFGIVSESTPLLEAKVDSSSSIDINSQLNAMLNN